MANFGNYTIAQALVECANRILQHAVNTSIIPGNVANIINQRLNQEMETLCNYVLNTFVKDNQFDDNVVTNWLKGVFENWCNEMGLVPNNYNYGYQNAPYGGMCNYSYNNGYGNYGPYPTRPPFGAQVNQNFMQAAQCQPMYNSQPYNPYGNGQRFDPRMASAPMIGNTGANSSMMGIGSALGKQVMNNNSNVQNNTNMFVQPVQNNAQPMNPVERTAQAYTSSYIHSTQNTTDNTTTEQVVTLNTPLEAPKENLLSAALKKSIRDRLNKRNKLKNIDKITNNDTELLMGDFVTNKIFDEEIAIVDNRNLPGLVGQIKENETSETIECIEHVQSSSITDKVEDDTSLDIINIDIPMNSATEAFEFVRNNVRGLNSNNKFYMLVSYDELTARRLNNDGISTSNIFNEISNMVSKLPDDTLYDGIVEYFREEIMPIIRKATNDGRAYLEKLIFDKFNDLFDRHCSTPYSHTCPSYLSSPGSISEILDEKNNEFSAYMYKYYGTKYSDAVKTCLFKALKNIFYNETIDIDSPVSKGILAHAAELYSVNYGRYRISDYGVMPEDSLKTMLNKIKRDFIVHTTKKTVLFTNVDINDEIPDAEYVYISNDVRLHEVIIGTVIDYADIIDDIHLLTLNKHNAVTSTMKISKLLDECTMIKRI